MSNRLMRALSIDINVFIRWYSLDPNASWLIIPDDAHPSVEYRPDLLCADGW